MKTESYSDIVNTYSDNLKGLSQELSSTLNNKNEEYIPRLVLNNDWEKFSNTPKIIFCGDNPGIKEAEKGCYFTNTSGVNLEVFINTIKAFYGAKNEEILFFNKTPYHSKKSKDFNSLEEKDKCLIYKSIEYTMECLLEIWKLNKNINFFIFGVDSNTYINKCFFEIITKENYDGFYDHFYFLDHPSNHALNKSIGELLLNKFQHSSKIESNKPLRLVFDEFIQELSNFKKKRIKPSI